MPEELITKEKKALLFGNEAIVRGALESGIGFSSSYPGTPASEIGDAFADIAKEAGIYFEWSTNEKVALEAAAGAVFSGIKSLVAMKHYGLNVSSDSLLPLVYLECPLVVVVADDPGCWSSVQTEQDTRWYSKIGKIPTLEPADSQEAKDMTKLAFELAWKYKIPILIRLTTRVCYSKSLVNLNNIVKGRIKGKFIKPEEFKLGSSITIGLHKKLIEKIKKIKEEISEKIKLNSIEKGNGGIGVITSGVSYNYVKESMQELKLKLPLLKIGMSYPFPENKVREFIKNLKKVIIVEELDPIIENQIKKFKDVNNKLEIHGKDLFQEAGELKPEDVLAAFSKIFGKKLPKEISENQKAFDNMDIKARIPFFCPGCPHRATFYAAKKAIPNKIFAGDIGCYMLGALPPYKLEDYVVSMGAGIGISHGISKSTGEKPVIFIGDSTFFHAGIPALINLVFNKADALVIILDNRYTAMTGQQPHPGTGYTAMKEETNKILIEDIAKACRVDNIAIANVYNINELIKTIKEIYNKKGVSVIVAKGECRLAMMRRLSHEGKIIPKFEIFEQKPELKELDALACPAITKRKGKYSIDEYLCWGCTLCKQLSQNSIRIKLKKEVVGEKKNEKF